MKSSCFSQRRTSYGSSRQSFERRPFAASSFWSDSGLIFRCRTHAKLSGCDLHELRSQIGSNTCRLFYFHKGQRVYVVTSGYVKKAHRTSRSEIDRAMRLKRKYEEASEQ